MRCRSLRGRLPMNRPGRNGSRKYGSSGGIEPLLESLLETADSVEVAGRVSVRFCPFKEEYLDPFALKAILDKMSTLATALENDAVRAGVPKVEVDRSRAQLEARIA